MKNSNNTIGNRTREFPACSAVPQPTALPRASNGGDGGGGGHYTPYPDGALTWT